MFCSSRFSKIFNGKEGRKLGKGGAGGFFLCFYSICSNWILVYYVSFVKVFIHSVNFDFAGPLLMPMGFDYILLVCNAHISGNVSDHNTKD